VGKKISLDAAADDLGVNKRTIRRLVDSGELPAYRIGTKLVRVDADDVAQLLKPVRPCNASVANGATLLRRTVQREPR